MEGSVGPKAGLDTAVTENVCVYQPNNRLFNLVTFDKYKSRKSIGFVKQNLDEELFYIDLQESYCFLLLGTHCL